MSHTITVQIEMRDRDAIAAAVTRMGGRVIGEGTHHLYGGEETGYAIHLEGWRYPMVIREDGTLCYDDYHGRWGDPQDIDELQAEYALARAEQECHRLGWYCERQDDGALLVYHPDGGTLRIEAGGTIDAAGFSGAGCAAATAPLAAALGSVTAEQRKPEYDQVHLTTMNGEEPA